MTTIHEPATKLIEEVVNSNPTVPISTNEQIKTVQQLFSKIINNKIYLGILIVVVVLLIVGLVLYKQYYHKLNIDFKIPFFNKKNETKQTKNNLLNLSEEYHIIDPKGEKILVTPFLIEILKQHCNQNNQQPQEPQQNKQQQMRPKLNHPGNSNNEKQVIPDPPSEVQNTEENNNTQALTMAEIEELKRQLNEMTNQDNNED